MEGINKIDKLMLTQGNRRYVAMTIKKRVGEYEQVEVTCSESTDDEDLGLRERVKRELELALKDAIEVYNKFKTEPKGNTESKMKPAKPATDKQKALIKKLAPDVPDVVVESLSKAEATKLIDNLMKKDDEPPF